MSESDTHSYDDPDHDCPQCLHNRITITDKPENEKTPRDRALEHGWFVEKHQGWANVPEGNPIIDRWRNYRQWIGVPHPYSYEDIELVIEVVEDGLKDFASDPRATFVWACESYNIVGVLVGVVCPWCSRCKMTAGIK